jgi:hypothetical protein
MEKTKNCWVIPTDKPSRLHLYTDEKGTRLETCELEYSNTRNTQHIYITSDEEIKEGDWVKLFVKHIDKDWIHKITKEDLLLYTDFNNEGSKIILTTDTDLIADGVQSIDDEFLEWFVKNPTCEEVETVKGKMKLNDDGQEYGFPDMSKYKIVIPQEEPKHNCRYSKAMNQPYPRLCVDCGKEEPKQEHCDCKRAYKEALSGICELCWDEKYPTKQETLEEAAEKWVRQPIIGTKRESFIAGAKWQVERMYSDEDMETLIDIIKWYDERMYSEEDLDTFRKFMIQEQNYSKSCLDVFIKQFKKK